MTFYFLKSKLFIHTHFSKINRKKYHRWTGHIEPPNLFFFHMKKAEHIEGKDKCSKGRDTLNRRKLEQILFSFLKYLKGV